jgi:hypothetical protein
MRHTLKAVFAHQSDAQHVLDELLASGYPRAAMALSSPATTGPGGTGHTAGLGASLRHAAARFAARHHWHVDADAGTPAAERHVLTLTTESEPDAERAAAIIAQCNPAGLEDIPDNVDPGAGTWIGPMPRRYPPGTAPGALQHRPHEESRYFGTQNAEAPPAGNTFQETMGTIAQWSAPDDGDTWTRPAGGSDSRASGQAWDDVEPGLKSDWERRHAGSEASTWDKVKTAMRHGWERTMH